MPPLMSAFERRARRVRRGLRRYPALEPVVSRVGTLLWRWHLVRSARGRRGEAALPIRIDIDPCAIERAVWRHDILALGGTTYQRNVVGLVRGGSWDEAAFPLSRLGVFEAVRRRFEEGAEWRDTPFYREVEKALARGERPFKFREVSDLRRIFAKVDALHAGIAASGYRSQEELRTGRPWDEVVLAFDRLGRPCFVDGRHRLAVARVLHLPRIPALVAVRHQRWARLAAEARADVRERGGTADWPYLHPDLADIPSYQGHECFDLLLEALPVRSGTLVDLGGRTGYFCHRFEEVGFDCIALVRSEREAHVLTTLRDASGRKFSVLKGSLTEVELPAEVDVVLALISFHQFLKTQTAFGELEAYLRRLRTRYMLFQAHLADDPQMADVYRAMPPEELLEWVRRTGGFERATEVGNTADGRPIFLLTSRGP